MLSRNIILLSCIIFGLTGCSWFKKEKETNYKPTVEELYNEATAALEDNKFKTAVSKFEEIERTFPYEKWARKSQIMSAYSSYVDTDYDSALAALERYIKLHPGSEDIAYAYYLRALCYYEQVSDVKRDQYYSLLARNALQEVVARFPDTEYARDAQIKVDLVVDHLAAKEVDVGRFYLKKGNITGAINRFKKVVSDYQTTTHIQEALHRLVESYVTLGVLDEAKRYAAVLGHNYPASIWYKRSHGLVSKFDDTLQAPQKYQEPFEKKKLRAPDIKKLLLSPFKWGKKE